MGLSRRRDASMIWPGFVDAVTTLLMVMMFVLTIFTVMQAVLRDTITTQGAELGELNAQVAQLADALGLERKRAEGLQADLTVALGNITRLNQENTGLAADLAAATAKGTSLEALVANLQAKGKADAASLAEMQEKLKSSGDELAALTLQLEEKRKEAEEVLTLLAAARATGNRATALVLERRDAIAAYLPLLEVHSPHLAEAAWWRSQDRAEPDDAGGFRLLGRADRIVKVEERRVSLEALERQIQAHPSVKEARVLLLGGARSALAAVVAMADGVPVVDFGDSLKIKTPWQGGDGTAWNEPKREKKAAK